VVQPHRAAESKGQHYGGKTVLNVRNLFLYSTNLKLVNQTEGTSINGCDFCKGHSVA